MSFYDVGVERLVIDFETGVIKDAADYMPRKKAPANYKKEESIQKFEEKAFQSELDGAALDIDLCRIACVAWKEPGMPAPLGYLAKNEEEERKLLVNFTKRLKSAAGPGSKIVVGHNVLDFDIPLYLRRCLYLGVTPIEIQVDRFRHPRVVDLMQHLSFNGKLKFRSKDFYCRRFGITSPLDDGTTGADIPRLLAMGDYMSVLKHCKADVDKEYQLAVRVGVIEEVHAEFSRGLSSADQPF